MKLCYKCKKRPAVVFIQGMSQDGNSTGEPQGLCLICAKEAGIKPIDDMLKGMNISDEEIEEMSEQFMGLMEQEGDLDDEDDAFSLGGAATFPFLNGIFGNMQKAGDPKEKSKLPKITIRPKIKRKNASLSISSAPI